MRANDTFRFLANNSVALDHHSLARCYAPIMREDASGLYNYLLAAFDNGRRAHQMTEIMTYLQCDLARLEQALSVLIVFKLVTIYQDKNSFWFKLSPCLPKDDFLRQPLYRHLLERHIGQEAVADMLVEIPQGLRELTKTFSHVFTAYGDLEKELKEPISFKDDFDWVSFKQLMSNDGLVFGNEAEDSLALYHLADKYQLTWYKTYLVAKETAIQLKISPTRMAQKLEGGWRTEGKLAPQSFTDKEKTLLLEVKNHRPEMFLAKIKHELKAPTITADERQVLQNLAEMGFLDELINLMVMYTFNMTNSANLNQRYVLKLANDFASQGVQTAEMAMEKLRQVKESKASRPSDKKPKTNVPKWSNENYKNETTEEERRYLEEYKRQALERLRKGEE